MHEIIFCNKRALKEIENLPVGIRAACKRLLLLVEQNGPYLPMPYARSLSNGLWELRANGKEGIGRTIYFAQVDDKIIILRTFVKKTQKTPKHELELAKKRLKEWNNE